MIAIEYIPEGSLDFPLIRLFEFNADDAAKLQAACDALAAGETAEVKLEAMPWVRPIGGRRLWPRACAKNRGVRTTSPDGRAPKFASQPFVMEYNREGWSEVAEKLGPFLAGSEGFQWLTNEGDVNVLISQDGQW